jgi:hypothetical protein
MNQIAVKQMEPRMIDLLRARTLIYRRAKNYQAVALAITLIFPVLGGIAAAYAPALRPFVAFFALLFGFVDVVLLDRWHKARLRTAAKLQEDFDCTVLSMEWNKFLVGAKVDPEEVFEDACKKLRDSDEQRLLHWYPLAVQALPLHLARLVCQRTNLWYDSKLRQIYCWVLIGGLVVLAAIAGTVSLSIDFTMTSFVMTVLAPMTPVVTWIIRECNRQTDTVTLLDRLKGEVEKLWETSLSSASEQSVSARSRELQDAIYNHRVSSPLIFDWIYSLNRNSLEARMNVGADHWIRELTELTPQ